jgi:polyphenol oxidase
MEFAKDKLEWLEFDLLKEHPQIVHGVFLRHGGTSQSPFGSLNLSDSVGDHPDSIRVNRETVRKSLGLPQVVYAKQEHKAVVCEVTAANCNKLPPADALFTRVKDLGLGITHADCQATVMYDPRKEVIAVVHAGYKGLASNIYKATVEALKAAVGTNPKDLLVCVSPSLGPDHAEFINYKTELPESFWKHEVKQKYFDLWKAAEEQLQDLGIKESNIELTKVCTFCEAKDYYSHRRDKKTGRHATIAAIKS